MNNAKINWDKHGVPYACDFNDVYFSTENALEESRCIFIAANQLTQRWSQWSEKRAFVIAETGFGSGLNFLATWRHWQQQQSHVTLVYRAIERFPLHVQDLQRCLQNWDELQYLSTALIKQYPPAVPGFHRLYFEQGRVILDLCLGDVSDILPQWSAYFDQQTPDTQASMVDAWYLDGFAPAKNPDMWTPDLYQHMARLSQVGATFGTFTAAGHVRRGLQQAGFKVDKQPGFGHKRERLCGVYEGTESLYTAQQTSKKPSSKQPPWFRNTSPKFTDKKALILGGGVAGTSIAYSLAQRGWSLHLVEAQAQLARGASGNAQGAVYPLLSADWSPATRFYLQAMLLIQRRLDSLRDAGFDIPGNWCGVLLPASTIQQQKKQQQIIQNLQLPAKVVQLCSASETKQHCGINLHHPGLWFSQAGWLSPATLCHAQWHKAAQQTQAQLSLNCRIQKISRHNGLWQLWRDGQCIAQAPVLILANAWEALKLLPELELPLQAVRGQVSYPPQTPDSAKLRSVVCETAYLTPTNTTGLHCLGASYTPGDTDTTLSIAEHQQNLQQLQSLPALANSLDTQEELIHDWAGRVSVRCSSRDHLPVVGAIPEKQAFFEDYAEMHLGKRFDTYPQEPRMQNLYASLGHGSRGLLSAPLAAELIAAQMNAEPLPLADDLQRALSPQRFWVRQLKSST
ncbi:bifunctional tRNA (5-methylaminomethyl-2-thiouridine)(34)-methyltransferase MnmD/FAD-dependent 5-carboxymethylaminomethyl-2-thiouridine(34) oxidoreductase MnmC [Candidatus Venteria ishoeyi]|uniref:bifunctional tRNA (5-methylaminomethyl-2-thiouridine)(34)-methyltransferase MnmD/FAD-dependent 5-carboxymethylaminomethyl-2-thiouridine(34) oxidoreductase MnmC n=1 Tax=Candidatus Venteria ishoeyi TaxID=1899563 RepID=UPI000AEAD8DB|nr:bifunctional tRNA (5-methylaminomethyl-2-thiouridine)(34)-methyltransferase MnmD/FAD-dependent 5-carboxymethylaminomethyl-2-thiouridine(34) oxidoreductase MnmC [Candidatus Venteria ishoeyi]